MGSPGRNAELRFSKSEPRTKAQSPPAGARGRGGVLRRRAALPPSAELRGHCSPPQVPAQRPPPRPRAKGHAGQPAPKPLLILDLHDADAVQILIYKNQAKLNVDI